MKIDILNLSISDDERTMIIASLLSALDDPDSLHNSGPEEISRAYALLKRLKG